MMRKSLAPSLVAGKKAAAPGRPRSVSSATWAFGLSLSAVLIAVIGFGGVYSYIWVPVSIGLFLGVIVLLWGWVLGRYELKVHVLLYPLLGFGLLVTLQWLAKWSVYPGATATELVQLCACGCIFFLTLQTSAKTHIIRLGQALWLFCGLLSAEAICQFFTARGYIYWFHNASYANPVGPFVYHNHFAGCMDLLLPMTVIYAFRHEPALEPQWVTWLRRGMVPALGLAAMVISQSRGGIITLSFECIVGLWAFWPELKNSRSPRYALAAGIVMLGFFSYLANWKPILSRFFALGNHDPDFWDRVRVAESCWHIFIAHPWLGTGFNTFARVYPAYQLFDNGLIFLYAHNDYAQALAETGIAGALCVILFLWIWCLGFWRRRQNKNAPVLVRNLQLAAFISTAGLLFHSLGDFQFHAPANAFLFFLLAAAAVLPAAAVEKTRKVPPEPSAYPFPGPSNGHFRAQSDSKNR